MSRLKGKIALVTGGARGLGFYDCLEFAKEGASAIVIVDVLEKEMEHAAKQINLVSNCKVINKKLDIKDEVGWRLLVEEIDNQFGKLDILVNNAGVSGRNTLLECELKDWQRVIDINQTGVFLSMKYCAPLLKKAKTSSIINISSVAGLTGYFAWAYTAAKWAVTGMTKAAAMELSDWGIRVNSVHPSFTWTDMTGDSKEMINSFTKVVAMERAGNPVEIAKAVLFLASDESSFITGTEIIVDGGLMAGGGLRMVTKEFGLYK